MKTLSVTRDMTDEFDEVVWPVGTILIWSNERKRYEGRNPRTGRRIVLKAEYGNGVVGEYIEEFEKEESE